MPEVKAGGPRAARTLGHLLHQYAKFPAEGAEHLASKRTDRVLDRLGRWDVIRVARESRRAGADPQEALHLFLEFARIHDYLRRKPDRRLSILLIGRTGVGKSTTLN